MSSAASISADDIACRLPSSFALLFHVCGDDTSACTHTHMHTQTSEWRIANESMTKSREKLNLSLSVHSAMHRYYATASFTHPPVYTVSYLKRPRSRVGVHANSTHPQLRRDKCAVGALLNKNAHKTMIGEGSLCVRVRVSSPKNETPTSELDVMYSTGRGYKSSSFIGFCRISSDFFALRVALGR